MALNNQIVMLTRNHFKEEFLALSLVALAVLLAVFVGCSSNTKINESESKRPGKTSEGVSNHAEKVGRKYADLGHFLEEDEKGSLNKVHEKYQNILNEWHAKHGAKIRESRKALSDFLQTKNKKRAKESIRQAKKNNVKNLILAEQKIQKEYEAAILAVVPEVKLKQWQAEKISQTLLEFLAPLDLTGEQVLEVRKLAPLALNQVRTNDKAAWHQLGTSNLEKLFGQKVVIDSQKQSFEELKKRNKLRMLKWSQ